jgi:hypothetical protein
LLSITTLDLFRSKNAALTFFKTLRIFKKLKNCQKDSVSSGDYFARELIPKRLANKDPEKLFGRFPTLQSNGSTQNHFLPRDSAAQLLASRQRRGFEITLNYLGAIEVSASQNRMVASLDDRLPNQYLSLRKNQKPPKH